MGNTKIRVAKFGGSSLADAAQFRKVKEIVESDPARRYVVPSAPGRRSSGDEKVTDLLYCCYGRAVNGENYKEVLERIRARYEEIIRELHLSVTLDRQFAVIEEAFLAGARR